MTLLEQIRATANRRLLFLPHAIRQMARPERMISTGEVRTVLEHGVMVEEYPQDPRGASGLLLGWGRGDRALHVVVAPKPEYLAIITAYVPDPAVWEAGFKVRRRP